eukprot:CAMPEP_0202686480 /NCGR_PEP_ID=MMETSP1385-20130828/2248_1 /ASSEMBLY_ACC=CAM_ASM_000861 /TAXON_ID=933848 /ORGANISM="Elphidium margaritaceum" /LENGTH=183 /DNA_ID=CAMNT_0049341063 /DNA_START=270 /DNA_END=821 /DNA_ORIENTATION=+
MDDDFFSNYDKVDVYDNPNHVDTDIGDEELPTLNDTGRPADDEHVDYCRMLNLTQCVSKLYYNGDRQCAFNANQNECYTILRKSETDATFDDGYYAAHQLYQKDVSKIQVMIASMGGVIGLLCALISIGAYWKCKRAELMKKTDELYMVHSVQTHMHIEAHDADADPEIVDDETHNDEQEKLN